MQRLIIFFIIILFYTKPLYAYLGPGVGGGVIFATLGFLIALFAAIFGLIWFPLKRFLNKRKKKEIIKKLFS